MIQVTGKSAVRECTATYIDPESREEHKITVEYYSHTSASLREMMADVDRQEAEYAKQAEAHERKVAEAIEKKKPLPAAMPRRFIFPLVLSLSRLIHALPDLTDAKGKAFAITSENLETITQENLDLIDKAIRDDVDAKKSKPAE
jgi:hypothetical protein